MSPQEKLINACKKITELMSAPDRGLASWHIAVEAEYQKIRSSVEENEKARKNGTITLEDLTRKRND